jgi:hypothetical protein
MPQVTPAPGARSPTPRLTETPRTSAARNEKALAQQIERRSQIRGLLLLALAAIVFAILRAGAHRVFTIGWWRFGR